MKPIITFGTLNLPRSPSRPNDLRAINTALENVYRFFGDEAMLLPVPADAARQVVVRCPAITLQQSRDFGHRARLTRENIAVGCAHGGLFAILFPTNSARDDFLKANPRLRESLITNGPLGSVLWLRCSGHSPATMTVAGCPSWFGAGAAIIVAGRGALEPAFTIQNLAKPVQVTFDDIVWPEKMRVEFIFQNIGRTHGGHIACDPRDRPIPNWDFWARCFAAIHHLRYDAARTAFFQCMPGQEIQLLSEERVLLMISEFLASYGGQERFTILLKFRQPRFLKQFVTVLRIVSASTARAQVDLEMFLTSNFEACRGATVSSAELITMQEQYFMAKKSPAYPPPIFEKRLPAYIKRLFRGVQSRKIQRHGKYCRGYKHVRLKHQGAA